MGSELIVGGLVLSALGTAYGAYESREARKDAEASTKKARKKAEADQAQAKNETRSSKWRAAMFAERSRLSGSNKGRAGTFATGPAGISNLNKQKLGE